ncbi:unnamed protein product, partial [Rotaria socialis]
DSSQFGYFVQEHQWSVSHDGRLLESTEILRKVTQIREKALHPTHPNSATSYNHIDLVYYGMVECSKALPLLEKALGIFRKSLPPAHPNIKVLLSAIDRVKEKL